LVNRKNYLLMKQHLTYLDEVQQMTRVSLEKYHFCLKHLIRWADEALLSKPTSIRPTFPAYVSSLPGRRGEKNISIASQKKIIQAAKRFFFWAKTTFPRQFRTLPIPWIEALRAPRYAQGVEVHKFVSLEEVMRLATFQIEEYDLALKRDQAAAAMLFLSGMRATAFATLPIMAVNLGEKSIKQWPELGVQTKNGKRAKTYLLPIPKLMNVVEEWDSRVRNLLDSSARWYAPIENCWGEQSLSTKAPGENRAQALSKRLRILYKTVGLEYQSPHKFRHGNAVYGLQHARTMADYKAVSMNLMHSNIKVTDQIYAPMLPEEVGCRIAGLTSEPPDQHEGKLPVGFNNLTDDQLASLMRVAAQRLSG